MIVSQGFGKKPSSTGSGGFLSFTQDVLFPVLESDVPTTGVSANAADALSANITNVSLTCDVIYEVTADT